jgi:hypothetical protein
VSRHRALDLRSLAPQSSLIQWEINADVVLILFLPAAGLGTSVPMHPLGG